MTHQVPIVLTGTSLGAGCDEVLRTAAAVARQLGAELHVAHAFFVSDFLGDEEEDLSPATGEEIVDWGAAPERELEEQLTRLGLTDEVAERHCEPGPPHRVIADLAARSAPVLVVVGGAEGEAARRRGLGSTAARLLARVPCPVLVIHRELQLPLRRVIATTDLSPISAETLAEGLDLVGRLSDGAAPPSIEVLLALDPRRHRPLGRLTDERAGEIADAHLASFVAETVPGLEGRVATRVVAGDPAIRLVAEIAEARPDLVVLGTHGRGGFERFLLGSVAAEVTARAPIAALVVPPAAARQAATDDV